MRWMFDKIVVVCNRELILWYLLHTQLAGIILLLIFFPSKVCNSKNITRMSYFLRLSRYKGKMKKVNAILRSWSTRFMNKDTTINPTFLVKLYRIIWLKSPNSPHEISPNSIVLAKNIPLSNAYIMNFSPNFILSFLIPPGCEPRTKYHPQYKWRFSRKLLLPCGGSRIYPHYLKKCRGVDDWSSQDFQFGIANWCGGGKCKHQLCCRCDSWI